MSVESEIVRDMPPELYVLTADMGGINVYRSRPDTNRQIGVSFDVKNAQRWRGMK